MTEPTTPPPRRWRSRLLYGGTIVVVAVITFLMTLLLVNIFERKQEGQQYYLQLVKLDENTIDPETWGQNFPRHYNSYLRTVDTERTRYGGSEAFSRLDEDPRLKRIFAGYAFSIEYREERGHAYMLKDQEETERVKLAKQPGACLHCHASVIPAYRKAGNGDVMKGFELVCAMPWEEARPMVEHPVACIDCHDPKTIQLRVTRPGFQVAIHELAKSDYPVPHLPSIERWRKSKKGNYDVNKEATRQEMRSFVCGQCHVEYYFKGEGKLLTYPWSDGLKMEQVENYYDKIDFKDWAHAETGAPILKAQHPEFEMWNQGIHARSGVACADCHMPYKREGSIKVTDHHVRSPLLNISRACQTCHRYPEDEILARAETIQDRTKGMLDRAEDALVQLMDTIQLARGGVTGVQQMAALAQTMSSGGGITGVPSLAVGPVRTEAILAPKLAVARPLHRKAQWRMDFVAAENSMGFHASQEAARILAEAIDYARQGQVRFRDER